MYIGKQIKRLRQEKNVTQDVLADYLGLSAQAISKWENEVTAPDIGLLPAISIFFGVKIDELFRLPSESHFDRIENMFFNEREISEENFRYAETFLNEQLEDNQNHARALGDLAHLYNHRANSLHQTAELYAKKVLELEPDTHSHHVALWDACHAVCGDEHFDNHFEVIEYYKNFLDRNPNNRRALITLVENMLADKRYVDAIGYIDQLKGDHVYHIYSGDVALAGGDLDKALSHWDQASQNHPGVWQVHCSKADRYYRLGKKELAIKDYEKAMEVQSGDIMIDPLLSLAQLYETDCAYDKAIQILERQIDILVKDYKIKSGELIDRPRREIRRLMELMI